MENNRFKTYKCIFLLLLSFLVYFPLNTWFQSDDIVGATYAHEFSNVIHDFFGPQYGLRNTVLFWRPLITASFWLDQALFGSNPFGYHLNNTIVHALNTLLVWLVLWRFIGNKWAFRATLLWALHPALAGSVLWAAGRVDVHSCFWILLSLLFHIRWLEGKGTRIPGMIFFALGLATKELAIFLPLMVFGLTLARAPSPWIRRTLHEALRHSTPYIAILFPY